MERAQEWGEQRVDEAAVRHPVGEIGADDPPPVTIAVADTVRQDLLVEAARRLGRDPAFERVDDREITDAVTTGAAELAAATARWLGALAEFVVRGLWATDGASTPAVWLSWACGIGSSTAREHVRVALRLRDCPLVAERFGAGRLSYSKVRAITRVCTPELEPMLLAWADAAPAAILERIVADARRVQRAADAPPDRHDLGATRRWLDDGTYELTVRVDAATGLGVDQHLERLLELDGGTATSSVPEVAEETSAAGIGEADPVGLSAEARARPSRAHRTAAVVVDALSAAVAAGPTDSSGADRHTIVVHLPAAPARPTDGGTREHTRGRWSRATLVADGRGRVRAMSARQLRRLACTPRVQVIGGSSGNPADLGRARREPDARLRRLLLARDRTCRFPGCGAHTHLHAHHVAWWSHGGRTDLGNLVLLCRHHHAVVHDRGWQLRPASEPGRWTFHPPSDHAAADRGPWPASRPSVGASAGAVRLAAAVHAPELGPTSLRPPGWDGSGYDHDLAVGVLLDRAAR